MSHRPEQLSDDILDRATEELRGETSLPGPSEMLLSETAAAITSQISVSPEVLRHDSETERRQRMTRIFRFSSLAAAVAILVAGFVFVTQTKQNTALAFEQVLNNLKKATSVTFHSEIENFGFYQETTQYLKGELQRIETRNYDRNTLEKKKPDEKPKPNGEYLTITNHKSKETLSLDHKNKTANKGILKGDMKSPNPLDAILSITEKNAVRLDDETLNGRKTQMYRLTHLGNHNSNKKDGARIWIDMETGHMVQAVFLFHSTDGQVAAKITCNQFKWNEPLDDKLFALDVPEGYKVLTQEEKARERAGHVLFGKIVEKIRKATSVSYRVTIDQANGWHYEEKAFIRGDVQRSEVTGTEQKMPDGTIKPSYDIVTINDFKNQMSFDISNNKKTAKKHEMSKWIKSVRPMDEVLKVLSIDSEYVGEEVVEGRKTKVYRHTNFEGEKIADGDTAKIWIDAETGLLVKALRITNANDPKSKSTSLFDHYEWNTPLKDELFAMDVPPGYTVVEKSLELVQSPMTYFSKVTENVKKARTVMFIALIEVGEYATVNDKRKLLAENHWIRFYQDGDLSRTELLEEDPNHKADNKIPRFKVIVAQMRNHETNECLEIKYPKQTARKIKLDLENNEAGNAGQMEKIMRFVKGLNAENSKYLGESTRRDQTIHQYRITKFDNELTRGMDDCVVTVHPESGFPTHILLGKFHDEKEKYSIVMSDIQWNKKLDLDLFSMKIPAGFTELEPKTMRSRSNQPVGDRNTPQKR